MAYHLYAPRHTAALYLAWEYGVRIANNALREYPRDERGWIDLSASTALQIFSKRHRGYAIPTRRAAERAKARVAIAVAYLEGRLGHPLTGGLVEIQER